MPSCLGLYIENNLIKYAKVSKNNETIKVESFGVKFYENIEMAIKQIVEETYSFKIPISINSSDEWYNNVEIFGLLNRKDMDNAIKTEFENICYEKDINQNIYEQRYIYTNQVGANDKLKVIYVAVPKTTIEQRKKQFAEYKINSIMPISVSIASLVPKEKNGNSLIVNIEKNTIITKLTNNVISDIEVIELGSKEILDKINQKENSYSKSYEICKAATIYTETDRDLQYEENEYLEDIMPNLYQIASEIKRYIDSTTDSVEKIYITGTGALINNIDIYFQDYFKSIQCEILKPNFISGNNVKINIKDYIEVNSAISIGLQGLEKTNRDINFRSETNVEKTKALLTSNIKDVGESEITKNVKDFLGRFSKQFNMASTTIGLLLLLYLGGIVGYNYQLDNKLDEAQKSINLTNSRIAEIKGYNRSFNNQITTYQNLIRSIQELNDANSEDKRYRNTIPNLLNNIMVVIPKNVQVISIKNDTDTHVAITAKSNQFQQIAYFKTKLSTEGILKNVVSDTGTSQDGYLTVTIEGDLP